MTSSPSRGASSAAGPRQSAGSPPLPRSRSASPAYGGRDGDRSPARRVSSPERGRTPTREHRGGTKRPRHAISDSAGSISPSPLPPQRRRRAASWSGTEGTDSEDSGATSVVAYTSVEDASDDYMSDVGESASGHASVQPRKLSDFMDVIEQGKNRGRQTLPSKYLDYVEKRGVSPALLLAGGPGRPRVTDVNQGIARDLKECKAKYIGLHQEDVPKHPEAGATNSIDKPLSTLTRLASAVMALAASMRDGRLPETQAADRFFVVGHALAGELSHLRRALAAYHSANRDPTVSMAKALEAVGSLHPVVVDGQPMLYDKDDFQAVVKSLKPKKSGVEHFKGKGQHARTRSRNEYTRYERSDRDHSKSSHRPYTGDKTYNKGAPATKDRS
ncbi:hypothetical protein BCR44DRAFT_46539 [Catenaria anguillulae PL171]|uniref:Uncharacterized protein n=1 Tax=Catenaria anguillulae PL171 TaxID=765915 RepID=A0A1Y2HCD0_9FUNG|nr:hypothetical protein BCR44DRAFT_46539 [Catenaria anguillulae PL171]